MKTINVYFEEEEYEQLQRAKGGLPWHDFILIADKLETLRCKYCQWHTSCHYSSRMINYKAMKQRELPKCPVLITETLTKEAKKLKRKESE